ncbi:DUF2092 domain-containing protein [Thermosynechococcaceae cyanobacterium BACA0444]|uniref:DUF2092 domain-containing protein n=1 Tax=Pseudocalidococcus azoricus BACA0444 TaxID=2918990 RepID=A0AAE4FV20_9CYAN|nr:DUF2092 domain-containing protein [Pseudocalidococcus azoricus]MDS3861864.1 DUF2092 domain-containing protein [Pseudocalidococcus azoricus BACA0444]
MHIQSFVPKLSFLVLTLLAWGTTATEAQSQTPPNVNPIDPAAIKILKAMGEQLQAAQTFSFTATTAYESPSRLGPPLVYFSSSQVLVQRPNNLRVITTADGPRSEFYYNGQTMVAFAPNENLVATAAAPNNLDDALKEAYQKASIYFPFTDFIVSNPHEDLIKELKFAFVVGQSQVVGGTTTDIVALGNDQIFAQVWIGAKDHLPRALRAVYRDDPSRLRHQVEFSNWLLNPPVTATMFTPTNTAKALKIPFAAPVILNPPKPSSK